MPSTLSLVWVQVMDMFVEQTHDIETQMRDGEKPMRFTDTRLDEQERGVSLKMVPMSLVMEGTSGKSYLMNLIDTPGVQRSPSMTELSQSHSWVLGTRSLRTRVQRSCSCDHDSSLELGQQGREDEQSEAVYGEHAM